VVEWVKAEDLDRMDTYSAPVTDPNAQPDEQAFNIF
jgi:hypothetical protein